MSPVAPCRDDDGGPRRGERERACAASHVAGTCATSGRPIEAFLAGRFMPSRRRPTAICGWLRRKGLVRFDGVTFRLLEPRGAPANTGPTVLGVVPAPDGSLWARLRGLALLRYQHDTFENILPALGPPESVVSAMVGGRDNSILVATVGRGALLYRSGRFDRIVDASALPSSSFVISMAQTPNGEFWLGTRGAGVVRVQGTRVTRLTGELPDLKVNSLLAMDGGDVWIGTDKGVARWTGAGDQHVRHAGELTNLQALAMIRDRAANSGSRPDRTDSCAWTIADARAAGSRTARPAAMCRRCSRIGTGICGSVRIAGSTRWRDPVFTTFSTAQGVPPTAIGPVYVDDRGRAWFAPTSGGLFWVEDGVVGRIDRSRPRSRCCLLDRRRQATTCGSADSAAVSRVCDVRRAVVRPCGSLTPTGWRRTASTPLRSHATARSGRAR